MTPRLSLLSLALAVLPHVAAAEAGRAKALAREPVTMVVLESGNVVLPAGTEFELVVRGPASVRLRHRIGEVSVSRAQVERTGSPESEGGGAFSGRGRRGESQPRPLRMPQPGFRKHGPAVWARARGRRLGRCRGGST